MTKRREPWDNYPRLHRRLSGWADWIAGQYQDLGWNVYQGDQPEGLRVQLRNDLHADKVYQEVANMDSDIRRHIETNSAWKELPHLWRRLIWLLYVEREPYPKHSLAQHTGIDARRVSEELEKAFIRMDGVLAGMRMARSDAA